MTRPTKYVDIALERAVELLPEARLEKDNRTGYRSLTYQRPNGKLITVTDRKATVLHHAVFALITDARFGGFGRSLEDVRDHVQLTQVPNQSIGAHEELLLIALHPDERKRRDEVIHRSIRYKKGARR